MSDKASFDLPRAILQFLAEIPAPAGSIACRRLWSGDRHRMDLIANLCWIRRAMVLRSINPVNN
jgi:hypothetical protein